MRALAALALLLLAACHKPSFDERYEDAEKAVHEKAAAIDRELAEPTQAPASAASSAASPAR
jgi:hypothetical protein